MKTSRRTIIGWLMAAMIVRPNFEPEPEPKTTPSFKFKPGIPDPYYKNDPAWIRACEMHSERVERAFLFGIE